MSGRLSGKVAIVTGGASGIGRGTVERFAEEGASVVVADLQDDKGERLAEELGPRCAYLRTDVGEERDIEALVAFAVKKFGKLDCMFNNAGFAGVSGGIAETPAEGFDSTMRVLFRGVYLGIKHAARVMVKQKSGSIISTASVAGLYIGYGPHVYSAAKAAVIHLTKSVAMELGESNVRVNCICPGGIATPIFGKAMGLATQVADNTVDPMKQFLAQMQPIPRSGVPNDIANAALFLASDESSFVSGHALVVDGALLGGRKWSEREARGQMLRSALGALAE
ncbi:MAG TPA: glucose 1-dehydrogenase [Candidatus Cybelea sp.]|nr:glucose 1-dehydrogenase [Candidatus Cybelea sp.]